MHNAGLCVFSVVTEKAEGLLFLSNHDTLPNLFTTHCILPMRLGSAINTMFITFCRYPSVSRDYGNLLWIEVLEQRLVWLRRPIQEWHTEDKYNLSPVPLLDFAGFRTASLPQPAEQGSLQIQKGEVLQPQFAWTQQPLKIKSKVCCNLYTTP